MREIGRILTALVTLAALGWGGTAAAATLEAEYQLQGSRASAVSGAPDLADLGPGNQNGRVVVILVEPASTVNTGDVREERTAIELDRIDPSRTT